MTNVLVLGAAGSLAKVATRYLLDNSTAHLTLYLRNKARLQNPDTSRVTMVEGDVLDYERLKSVMTGKDIVYVNIAGNMKQQAETIVRAMKSTDVRRLIFISSMGIYDEVPREKYGDILAPYRASTEIIESSGLDYTVIRPAWFTNGQEIEYELTHRNEAFRGDSVSRLSIANLINRIVINPSIYLYDSLGIARV